MDLRDLGRRAKDASYVLAHASTAQKNAALLAIADALDANVEPILAENCLDLEAVSYTHLTLPTKRIV